MCDSEPFEKRDHFGPPEIPTMCRCLSCGEEYESFRMEWRVNGGVSHAKMPGFWCCPTSGCKGKGFGLDIWELDAVSDGDPNSAFDFEAGLGGEFDLESDLEFGIELGSEYGADFDLGIDGELGDILDPFAEIEGFFEGELSGGSLNADDSERLCEGEGGDEDGDEIVGIGSELIFSDEGWENLEPEFDHLLWCGLEFTGASRKDGLIGDPTPWGFVDPDHKSAFTEYLEESDEEDIPF